MRRGRWRWVEKGEEGGRDRMEGRGVKVGRDRWGRVVVTGGGEG